MSRYASGTEVTIDKSEAEIKKTLMRYGADDIVTGQSSRKGKAFVQFWYESLHIMVEIPLPTIEEKKFQLTEKGNERSEHQVQIEYEKACRQQWRVLLLLIKANLEAVENRIMEPQQAFLPWLILPNGQTVIKAVEPGLKKWIESGEQPKLLTFGGK
jgi:hypothetical protein